MLSAATQNPMRVGQARLAEKEPIHSIPLAKILVPRPNNHNQRPICVINSATYHWAHPQASDAPRDAFPLLEDGPGNLPATLISAFDSPAMEDETKWPSRAGIRVADSFTPALTKLRQYASK